MTPTDHPDTALAADDTFVVHNRPRAWLAFALLSMMSVVTTLVVVIGLWRVDPAILTESGVQLALMTFVLLAVGLGYTARHMARTKRVILTADALGVWVGIWGKRQGWADIATIRIRAAPGDMIGVHRFLAFEPHKTHPKALGRKIEASIGTRMIDLRTLKIDQDTLIGNLRRAALAGGYNLQPVAGAKTPTWDVAKAPDVAPLT